jgi:pimeloyl-ACP methyl ester carboxylesterase
VSPGPASWRRWLRRGFLLWGVVSLSWLANTVRTRGVAHSLLQSSPDVTVSVGPAGLAFLPPRLDAKAGLIFICGAGIHPNAYVPLLRPIADAGHAVFIVGLPYRFAPLSSHKEEAVARTTGLMATHPEVARWVVAGHSLGGALAARVAREEAGVDAAFVLVGTTHPRDDDLSALAAPFTKVYATNDEIAPESRIMANRGLLPRHTRWIRIEGGNHSQFGHYGHQLFDGTATISREAQQATTRGVLLAALEGPGDPE